MYASPISVLPNAMEPVVDLRSTRCGRSVMFFRKSSMLKKPLLSFGTNSALQSQESFSFALPHLRFP